VKSPNDPTVVGLRSSWTCAVCKRVARTYQLVFLARPESLRLPPNWGIVDGVTVCGAHFNDAPQKVEQAT
jgi:hypothetical protein